MALSGELSASDLLNAINTLIFKNNNSPLFVRYLAGVSVYEHYIFK